MQQALQFSVSLFNYICEENERVPSWSPPVIFTFVSLFMFMIFAELMYRLSFKIHLLSKLAYLNSSQGNLNFSGFLLVDCFSIIFDWTWELCPRYNVLNSYSKTVTKSPIYHCIWLIYSIERRNTVAACIQYWTNITNDADACREIINNSSVFWIFEVSPHIR